MWMMFAIPEADGLDPTILVVDDEGDPRCIASSVEDVIVWLGSVGQTQIGIPVEDGTEVYAIEPTGSSTLAHQSLALRRALLGAPPGHGQAANSAPDLPCVATAENRLARRKAHATHQRRSRRRWRVSH